MKYTSNSEAETYKIGYELAKDLKKGDVIAFFGDLGVGKTAFTKGVCGYFGIDYVHSPTFTIVNEYQGDITMYHFDAYRIDSQSWLDGGFDEYLFNDGICIIEWAENLTEVLPEDTIKITITRDLSKEYDYRDIEVLR
ncbi:MAG: tRNA (adenosine(37)-N6)-threonylcarbamoyltransferase complex ATPase subunit type 1 TsaE [Clostridia bacterium]|nr:tRNA (adenosine(37)-N6)-threonylcarbamoyltransferase complex ATPase subunit type 1 TsaE [Clostridia bacterium]